MRVPWFRLTHCSWGGKTNWALKPLEAKHCACCSNRKGQHGVPFVNRLAYGLFKPNMQMLGADVAEQIESVGKHVRQLQPGDMAFGFLCRSGWGGFAEFTCAREDTLTIVPSGLTFEQVASLPQAGLLAVCGLDFLLELIAAGKVHPLIDKTYPLAETVDAFRYYGDGRARGKVVITIDQDIGT